MNNPPEQKAILFYGTPEDKADIAYLKPYIGTHKCYVLTTPITTLYEVESYCNQRNITGVLTTSPVLLSKLAGRDKAVSLDAFSGSYFKKNGIEYVILNPLEQVHTVPYGKFLLERFASKITRPEKWLTVPKFQWRVIKNDADYQFALDWLQRSIIVGTDIETFSDPLSIRCVGYTGLQIDSSGQLATFTFVVPLSDDWQLGVVRNLNDTAAPKALQNGKYDHAYLARYDAPCANWQWDTATMMHAWYCELPKDLGFLQSFFVREAAYWKDMAESHDLEQYYLYNGKDTWATALVVWAWIHEAPEWAKRNYLMEFPVNFPAHMSEMIGIDRDFERMEVARREIDAAITRKLISLNKMLGTQDFNVNSPLHMKALFKMLGCGDLPSQDDKNMAKAAFRHPFNARIIDMIRGVPKSDDPELAGIRALRKIKSNYLRTDADATKTSKGGAKEFRGKVLFALIPHGTDSGRLASREHHFWCGLQLQNMPSGALVKQTLRAPEGFYFGEADLEQAETRDTAYITGDTALISAVTSARDFHSLNTASFFGVPYESVYDDTKKKVVNKVLRNLAKRVNHGANYNMGPQVMVDTMGEKTIYEAARLLRLRPGLSAIDIAEHLLAQFARTYPVVRKDYQEWVVHTIVTTKMLVGATGWTRYCFSDPRKNKPALNTYISHSPQSLNAMVLNKAYLRVFYDIAMHPKYRDHFRLVGQIHDSIPFFYRQGHEYLCDMVKERMEIPVIVRDIKGVERTFTVPAALKIGKTGADGVLKRAIYWSETE
jgi:DNA polymerase I-like protein with 3'-5' exonuclease and polymerase domains